MRPVEFTVIACKKNQKIEIDISCVDPKTGFQFNPSGLYYVIIDSRMMNGSPHYQRYVLSGEKGDKELKIKVIIKKQDKVKKEHAFTHHWKSGKDYSVSLGFVKCRLVAFGDCMVAFNKPR